MAPVHNPSIINNPMFRKKQKYTIKNAEAWGERHGRPATYDNDGRALWKRPSDGRLVYLDCPAPDCGKSDFVTLHGFMCHLTKKHKDRTLGSQSRALEVCGTLYNPDAPRPQRPSLKRDSMGNRRGESSRGGSPHTEADVDVEGEGEGEGETNGTNIDGDEDDDEEEENYLISATPDTQHDLNNHASNGLIPRKVKKDESDTTSASLRESGTDGGLYGGTNEIPPPTTTTTTMTTKKASIASMIDSVVSSTNNAYSRGTSSPQQQHDTYRIGSSSADNERVAVPANPASDPEDAATIPAGQTIQV